MARRSTPARHRHRAANPTRHLHRRAAPTALYRTTPAAYISRPKASPATCIDNHQRVRIDRVDNYGSLTLRVNGKLHHISASRLHARTRVLMLVNDLDVRIIDAATTELIGHLTIDPTRDYQPRRAPGRPRKKL